MSEKTQETQTPKGGLPWYWRLAIKGLIVVVALAVLVIIGMKPAPDRTVEADRKHTPVNVKTMEIAFESQFADAFVLPAVVEPNRVVTISAEVAARIERIPLEEGEPVDKGDLLIELERRIDPPAIRQCRGPGQAR